MKDTTAKYSMTVQEAAEYIGVSADTVRGLVRAGVLEARYPSSRPVIRLSDLKAYVDAATERPSKDAD